MSSAPQPESQRPRMPEYGVTDDPEGLLPWSWAEDRLLSSRNYWVATATPTGRPHAMPVWAVWLPDAGELWFSCADSARKAANLRANPQIVVAVDSTAEVVSLEGRAREESSGESREIAIAAFVDKYEADTGDEGYADFLRENTFFAVSPERAFGMIETAEDFARAATRWVWPN